jgi:peroxin-19
LSAFSGLNFGKDGDDAKDVQGVLETLMGQLMSKEVLYEPLKELNDKVSRECPIRPTILYSKHP